MIKTWQQRCEEHPDHEGIVTEQMIRDRMQEEIDQLRQALAQPEQEPVTWFIQYEDSHEFVWSKPDGWRVKQALEIQPLYTAPPKREWVGLTAPEVHECYDLNPARFASRIEAKLKEKNNA